jgi:hypothetical protein
LALALRVATTLGAPRALLSATPAVLNLLARQIGSFGPGDGIGARLLDLRADQTDLRKVLTPREREVSVARWIGLTLDAVSGLDGVPTGTPWYSVRTFTETVHGKDPARLA